MQKLQEEAKELVGISLSDEHILAFSIYAQEMAEWNIRFNLTGIKEPEQVRRKHFLDSLSCLIAMQELGDQRIIDIGTGAGFPGVVFKIMFPEIRLVLVESAKKKTVFLEHLVETLNLKNVEIVNARAELVGQLPEHREKYDWVVARAVARLPVLVEYLLPLAKVGGKVLAQKGDNIAEEIAQANKAIGLLGGKLGELIPVELPEKLSKRILVVIRKISNTPQKYPRHDGTPAKNPL